MRPDQQSKAVQTSPVKGLDLRSCGRVFDYKSLEGHEDYDNQHHEFREQDLVVVRLKDNPAWPARVRKAEDFGLFTIPDTTFVSCFGTKEVRFCRNNEVMPITPSTKTFLKDKLSHESTRGKYRQAIEEFLDNESNAASDLLGDESGSGASTSTKRVRRVQDLFQSGHDDPSNSHITNKSLDDSLKQARAVFLCPGRKQRRLEDILASQKLRGSCEPDVQPASRLKNRKELVKTSDCPQRKLEASKMKRKVEALKIETCAPTFREKSRIQQLIPASKVEKSEFALRKSNRCQKLKIFDELVAFAARHASFSVLICNLRGELKNSTEAQKGSRLYMTRTLYDLEKDGPQEIWFAKYMNSDYSFAVAGTLLRSESGHSDGERVKKQLHSERKLRLSHPCDGSSHDDQCEAHIVMLVDNQILNLKWCESFTSFTVIPMEHRDPTYVVKETLEPR
ncbi:hypothetical protein AXG93_2053s1060 [Marchantia polymorpha subsp. ruderalis]|uniref:PWWP domain-containing protein n=1 Tax=Marchantia polymorpha subsp. ruderalis TaxID=1480154 RepID=A0A176VT99_MARPO|nr:hypothetical protein AXG93_2053s1060 [Marchantia polymorpha subsp. ruderalis]